MPKIYKNPIEQSNALAPESTRSKWNRYFKHIGDGNPRTVDKYNRLIEEIESELPFENEQEHQKWLDQSATWNGGPEWTDLTENLLQRAEATPLKHSAREFDEILKGNPYAKGIDWDEGMDYLREKLGVNIPENVSQLYRKNNYIYGVEGQSEGEPIDRILFRLGGK